MFMRFYPGGGIGHDRYGLKVNDVGTPDPSPESLESTNRHNLDDELRNLHQRGLGLGNEALGDDDVQDNRSECNDDVGEDERSDDDRSILDDDEVTNDVRHDQDGVDDEHGGEGNFDDDEMVNLEDLEDDDFADF